MTVETWTYLGEQPGQKLAKVAVWRREIDEPQIVVYKSTPNTRGRVGWQYSVNYDADARTAALSAREFLNVRAGDATELELEAAYHARLIAKAALERNAPRRAEIDAVMEPLMKLAKGLSMSARSALIEHVTRAVWSA